MPIRNLSEKIVEKEEKKTFKFKLNSEEKKDLKDLLKRRKDLRKYITSNLNINDSLEIKLTEIEDYFDEYIVACDGEHVDWLSEMISFDDIVKKKNGPALTVAEELLMELWNDSLSYGYYDEVMETSRFCSNHMKERKLMVLNLSKEFSSFFKAVEKRTENAGMFKRLLNMNMSEIREMIEILKRGHEVEIY